MISGSARRSYGRIGSKMRPRAVSGVGVSDRIRCADFSKVPGGRATGSVQKCVRGSLQAFAFSDCVGGCDSGNVKGGCMTDCLRFVFLDRLRHIHYRSLSFSPDGARRKPLMVANGR